MIESPTTQLSLLVRIRDCQDALAWGEFVDLYAPLVYALARRHGLQDADAADLTQDVLRTVVRTAPRFTYDPRRGSFHGWLFTVARNRLRRWANDRKRQVPTAALAADLEDYPAPEEDTALWDAGYRARLFEWAAEQVRPTFRPATWQAFWQTTVEDRDPRDVGAALGMSVGAVYIARSRVMARIREHVCRLHEE
jgi:RNA polymerase sigma-70 factor (ECF subfamily)